MASSLQLGSHRAHLDRHHLFAGIAAAYRATPRAVRSVLDAVTIVLPPTVVGYLLLRVLGPRRAVGAWVLAHWGVKLTMTWYSAMDS